MPDPIPRPNPSRDDRINGFLDANGWAGAARTPLAGDASFRRYHRVALGNRLAMLMDAPPPVENVRPFARLARHLRDLGFSAPEIFAEDDTAGFLLIEDFGEQTYTRALANGAGEPALYELAVDVLIALHRLPPDRMIPSGLPAYDDEPLLAEAFLMTDWYIPAVLGRQTAPDARQAYAEAWLSVFPAVHAQPRALVLRDYHVDNLMILKDRRDIASCGLLDFQDALAGPAAYDLVSLIEDARRDIDPELAASLHHRYEAAFPEMDREAFGRAFAVLAAQRHAKVIGIFTRLWRRDGKPNYLVHIPRVWRLLERALETPALAPVAKWFEEYVPPEKREIPECLPAAAP